MIMKGIDKIEAGRLFPLKLELELRRMRGDLIETYRMASK